MDNKPVLVNGKNIDYGNVQLIIFGTPFLGVTELEYQRNRETTNNYGQGYEPVGFGYGKVEYPDGSMTLYTEEIRNIARVSPGTSILEIPPFTITVIGIGDGITPFEDKLTNCRFKVDPFATKSGDTMIAMKVTFAYAGLFHKV